MTKTARRSVRVFGLVCVGLMSIACNTTPERPPPPPQPRIEPSPPPPQSTAPRTEPVPQDTADRAADTDADAEPSYAPPSANAAEVEFEEIPVDENGNPLPATPAAAAAPTPADDAANSAASGARTAGGGGGGNMPLARMNDVIEARERGAASGAALAPTEAAGNPDLVGPRMAIGALTTAEQIAATDAELDAGLAAFDERLRRARAAAEAERRLSGGGAPEGGTDGRGQRSAAPPEGGAGGAAATGTGLGNTPDLTGSTTGAPTVSVAGSPSGLPDGGDDDIVARQLREAALRETDPVLQAKLWDEYRKYKAGL